MQTLKFKSIRLRLISLTATSVVLTAGLGLYSGTTLSDFNRSAAALVTAGHAMRNHMEADMMHDAVRADVLGVLAARTPDERKQVRSDLEEHLQIFREALGRNEKMELPPAIEGALAAVGPELNRYAESAKEIFAMAETNRAMAERQYPEFLEAFEALEVKNAAASDLIQKAADETEDAERQEYTAGIRAILIVIAGVAIASLLASWLVARGIARALAELDRLLAQTSGSLTTASAEVAAASGAIADGASFQAQSVSEAADSSAQASMAAQANAAQCRESATLIGQLVERASGSQLAAQQLNDAMDALRRSSTRISGIVKEIEEIAFQTNLLALNASVEAARAGEAGAGFAVVAGEVGNLAQRATSAARETAQLIQESSGLSGQGAERARMVGDSIGGLLEAFDQVRKSIEVINGASREQSSTIAQISASVAKIQDVTQRNAANAEQNAAVSRELEGQAKSLDKVVSELRALAN